VTLFDKTTDIKSLRPLNERGPALSIKVASSGMTAEFHLFLFCDTSILLMRVAGFE
jgi:hypothetical protein